MPPPWTTQILSCNCNLTTHRDNRDQPKQTLNPELNDSRPPRIMPLAPLITEAAATTPSWRGAKEEFYVRTQPARCSLQLAAENRANLIPVVMPDWLDTDNNCLWDTINLGCLWIQLITKWGSKKRREDRVEFYFQIIPYMLISRLQVS